jgi:hypothetical protein
VNHHRLFIEDFYRILLQEATDAKQEASRNRGTESELFFQGKELGLYMSVSMFRSQLEAFQLSIDSSLMGIDVDYLLSPSRGEATDAEQE